MTEAEQERAERDRLDRIRQLREAHAGRRARKSAGDPPPVRLAPTVDGPPAGTITDRVLAYCRGAPEGSTIMRAPFFDAMGAGTTRQQNNLVSMVTSLRKRGKFPWHLEPGKSGPRPKDGAAPPPSSNGVPRPAPPPKPAPPTAPPAEAHDPVNHPAHYTSHPSGIEAIEVCEHMGFNVGNAIKYLWRADLKGNPLEDLKKAAWYVDREINLREKENTR